MCTFTFYRRDRSTCKKIIVVAAAHITAHSKLFLRGSAPSCNCRHSVISLLVSLVFMLAVYNKIDSVKVVGKIFMGHMQAQIN